MTSLPHAYLQLALAIDQHIDGYVDAYYGPPELRQQAQQAGARPVAELLQESQALAEAIQAGYSRNSQRSEHLAADVRAMQTVLRILQGELVDFTEQLAGMYDITPAFINESVFNDAYRTLEALLPRGASLPERMGAWRASREISPAQAAPLVEAILAELRSRTQAAFPLPPGETLEVRWVTGQRWAANNCYLGGLRSLIEINRDRPLQVGALSELIAHEAYPGHHTEAAIKESQLVRQQGFDEFTIALLYSPASLIAEGIAMRALSMAVNDEQWVEWHAHEIFPHAGFGDIDAAGERAILNALRAIMHGPLANAALLLHDQGLPETEVAAYLQRYALCSPADAARLMGLLSDPFHRSYVFCYFYGGTMLDALFAGRGQPQHWFTRLLSEPITPGRLRAWASDLAAKPEPD